MTKFTYGTALAAAALALAVPRVALAQKAPEAVIVIVDRQRIANECNACRTASAQLQGMVTAAQQRAQQLGPPLQTEEQSIQNAVDALQKQPPGAARTTAEAQLQGRIKSYQTRQNNASQEVQRLEQNIQSVSANIRRQILERLDPIVAIVMKTRGANIAFDETMTIAHAQGIDVTNEVLAQLNTALPTISATPLPQQPAAGAATPPAAQPPGR